MTNKERLEYIRGRLRERERIELLGSEERREEQEIWRGREMMGKGERWGVFFIADLSILTTYNFGIFLLFS